MEKDHYLEERKEIYDAWVTEGKIPTSSKVIPVFESVQGLQWVLPTNQVVEILRNSRSFALQDCGCRTRYKRCDNPIDVCLVINDMAERMVKKKKARYIDLDEAIEKIKLANQHGLVHLTIYNPEQHIYALCSCCECCCHDLQIMKKYERSDYIAHSDYIAEINKSSCINCGSCKERCVFGAYSTKTVKQQTKNEIFYNHKRCYGCGLCLPTCPTHSITMKLRDDNKRKISD